MSIDSYQGCIIPIYDLLIQPPPSSQGRGIQMRDVNRLIIVLGGLVAAVHLLARGVAAAQPVATPGVGVVPPPTDDATAIQLDPTMAFIIVLMLLLLALIVVALLFRYLRESRQDYYETIREFGRKGVYFNPVLVSSTAVAGEVEAPNGAQVETATFELAGPGIVALGQEARFAALRNGVAADSTTWVLTFADGTAVPTDRATLNQSAGSSVTLTAVKPGIYVLAATDPGPPALTLRSVITAQTLPAGSTLPDLPFIGQGYGSIVGAVIIVAALVVLAATRAIDADVVGVILGALTGYLFGAGITRNQD
jgi:hypothetical protein